MLNDFYVAILSGWLVLLVFWSMIIIFIYLRKPPNSKLSRKIIIRSYLIFIVFLLMILFFKQTDSFF